MDVCAKICAHYLSHDGVGDVSFDNGELVVPPMTEMPDECQWRRRIIIYAEFSSMTPLLQNVRKSRLAQTVANGKSQVLSLYGVPSLAVTGKIPFEQRDKRIKDLYDDTHPARVLIFSSVGSAGLNLSIADVVIFFVSENSTAFSHSKLNPYL